MNRYWPERRVREDLDYVWYAIDQETGERVVMKMVDKKYGIDSNENDKVFNEAKALKELSQEMPSRILEFKQFYENDEEQYVLIMERAGCGLDEVISKTAQLTEPDIKILILSLLEGLMHCHKLFYVHRDIKPANLFLKDLTSYDTLKIGDFGVSVVENGFSNVGGFSGTKPYMAPEVFQKKSYGRPVDIWAVGIVTYELFYGYTPFPITAKMFDSKVLSIMKKGPAFDGPYKTKPSREAISFIKRLLNMDPDKRPTAIEALQDPWLAVHEVNQGNSSRSSSSNSRQPRQLAITPRSLENGWLELQRPDGPPYYFHEPSGKTQWEHPSMTSSPQKPVGNSRVDELSKSFSDASLSPSFTAPPRTISKEIEPPALNTANSSSATDSHNSLYTPGTSRSDYPRDAITPVRSFEELLHHPDYATAKRLQKQTQEQNQSTVTSPQTNSEPGSARLTKPDTGAEENRSSVGGSMESLRMFDSPRNIQGEMGSNGSLGSNSALTLVESQVDGAPGWVSVYVPAGATYFYNSVTKETTWRLNGQPMNLSTGSTPPPPVPPPKDAMQSHISTPKSNIPPPLPPRNPIIVDGSVRGRASSLSTTANTNAHQNLKSRATTYK
ncbi:calcium calmodulin-dependent protein kinase type 1G [Chytridiales sp. JEL 0842]|nr:calcium calmodulin-dependent protein kinase type 1G [Chytridiales sp. JEL 0842]